MTNREILIQAAVLIGRSQSTLETGGSACACCGMVKRDNFDQYKAQQDLEAAANKLRRILQTPAMQDWLGQESRS